MILLPLNSVTLSWLIVLIISSFLGILVARTLGPQLQLRSIIILTVFNFVGVAALVTLMMLPTKTEGEVYVYAGVASVLIILLLMLLPPTLMLWFVRLRRKR